VRRCVPSDRSIQVGLHFALSGMYKNQEIEAADFQEQKDITGHERLVAFSSDLASFSALS